MSALEEYNAHRSWTKQRGQEYVRGDFSDAAINELKAEVERLAWMLHREWQLRTDDHDVGTFDDWLADLAARYDAQSDE